MQIRKTKKLSRVTLPMQSTFETLLEGDTFKNAWIVDLIRRKLIAQGVPVSDALLDQIAGQVRDNAASGMFTLELDPEPAVPVSLEFDASDVDGYVEFVANGAASALQEAVADIAPRLTAEVLKTLDLDWQERLRSVDGFRCRLLHRWRKPLKLLNAQIDLAAGFGQDSHHWLQDNAPDDVGSVVVAVARLQARAVQVAREIEVLLHNGFADGALGRWRTLYEIAVVALFIAQEGKETAVRYLDHLRVDSRDLARFLKKAERADGRAQISDDELAAIEAEVDALCQTHGDAFNGYYGWAWNAIEARRGAPIRPMRKRGGVTFFDIEEAVDMDRLRPYYKLASGAVHAGPKGTFFKLGLINARPDTILAGASNAGLSEAGRLTSWSLGMACIALMTVEPMLDGIVWGRVIAALAEQATEAFDVAERHLREEEGVVDDASVPRRMSGQRIPAGEKISARLRRRMGL